VRRARRGKGSSRTKAASSTWEREITFRIRDLSCRGCARRAQEVLARVDGVLRASVGLLRERARVRFDARRTSAREIAHAMARAGYRFDAPQPAGARGLRARGGSAASFALSLVGFANLITLSGLSSAQPSARAVGVAKLALCALVIVVGGASLLRHAWARRPEGGFGRALLSLVASIVCFGVGLLELACASQESTALPAWLFTLGFRTNAWQALPTWGFESAAGIVLAALVTQRAARAVESRARADIDRRAAARVASVRRLEEGDIEVAVPREELATGDRVRLCEGERAPCDVYLEGAARVLVRCPGGLVAAQREAGSVIAAGSIVLSAEARGRALRIDLDADASLDAEVERVLARGDQDRASASWVEIAGRTLAAAAMGFGGFALFAHGWFGGGPLSALALFSALAVLVGISPAALGLARPAARAIAILEARAAGVLVRDARALEELGAASVACFDKAGTVTGSERKVEGILWVDEQPDRALLEDIAAIAQHARRPLGRAIAAYLRAAGINPSLMDVRAGASETARSVGGWVRGAWVEVGAKELEDSTFARAQWREAREAGEVGERVVLFGRDHMLAGGFEISASLRPGAASVARALWDRGVGCRLLGGEPPKALAKIASKLGIPATGGLSTVGKALTVRDLQLGGARVLLVADGASEVGHRVQADVSVAITESALPIAIKAPIVVSRGRLEALPALLDLGRALRRRQRENLALGVVYNAALIPAATLGYLSPMQAAVLAAIESLLLLANTTRLWGSKLRAHGRVSPAAGPPRPSLGVVENARA